MNLRILTWVLAIAIFLLCLADGWLVLNGLKTNDVFKKTIDAKMEEFGRNVSLARENIRKEMNEKYKPGLDLYSDLAKKIETEKKRIRDLEESLTGKNKK
ncbi:MAG: hypothetical protein NTW09_03690 [Candidatus Omnitrophica bacterium]|nr:hypothetical protein [Candidatus Omnitrophota bacterium]